MTNYHLARKKMVENQIIGRGIRDRAVIRAMSTVPRHLFVGEALRDRAYGDFPLPIGNGQTISQPYMVARMTEALQLTGVEKVLEIGTGSGYQTAVLVETAGRVVSLERISSLLRRARATLENIGCHRVVVHLSDGTLGWKEAEPYDAILVAAGAPEVPKELVAQLVEGGRLVIPVGSMHQQSLKRLVRLEEGDRVEDLGSCVFVPLIGDKGWPDSRAGE